MLCALLALSMLSLFLENQTNLCFLFSPLVQPYTNQCFVYWMNTSLGTLKLCHVILFVHKSHQSGTESVLALITHDKSAKSCSQADLFDCICEKENVVKIIFFYQQCTFAKLGKAAASLLETYNNR